MTQTAQERQVLDWLAGQKPQMLALLQEVVDIDSGSFDKAGVDAVGARFVRFFAEHGLPTTIEPDATYGDAIHVRLDDVAHNQRPVLLMGHRDTVFPKGEVGRRPFRIEAGRAYGPGVADMKGGLVMNAFVLAAMKKFGSPVPVIGLITSDEEIASPSSRPIIERVARGCRAVLNAEPGRPSGNVVTGRKGGVFMAFEVTGKAAHSGGNFEKGISAIGELAHKVVALHALTGLRPGITVNVGLVKGGQSVNTTAPSAEGQIDLRYVKPEDRAVALGEIQRIMDTSTVKGAAASLTIRGEFPPLNASEAVADLLETYKAAAAVAGLAIEGEFTGGCADSGFTAGVGCPTVCATGPVGANAHTPEEVLEIETMVPRAQAVALTILRMPQQG